MDLASLSSNLLLVSFITYLIATLFFGGAVRGAKSEASYKNSRSGTIGIILTAIGLITHLGYFGTRWAASGHAPLSNMFEIHDRICNDARWCIHSRFIYIEHLHLVYLHCQLRLLLLVMQVCSQLK